jgi:hypothetical protein
MPDIYTVLRTKFMPQEYTYENLKKAFCEVLACTGIGAAVNNCESLLDEKVRKVVPEIEHGDYPAKLLKCAFEICTGFKYDWTVNNVVPVVDDTTTFRYLLDKWFLFIVW